LHELAAHFNIRDDLFETVVLFSNQRLSSAEAIPKTQRVNSCEYERTHNALNIAF